MNRRQLALVVAVLAAYKSVEHAVMHGPALWVLTGALLLLGALWTPLRPRAGMAVVAAGALVVNLTPVYRNHLALLMWVALALALFSDDHATRIALRCQLTLMYGFAALAKLWPDWLSGEALGVRTWVGAIMPEGLLVTVAWVTVIVEAGLAVAVWSRHQAWFLLAAGTHLSFLAFTYLHPWGVGRLAVFGALSLATWLFAARAFSPARACPPAGPRREPSPTS